MSKDMCSGRRLAGVLVVLLAFMGMTVVGCTEEFVGCEDDCGCVLLASYVDSDGDFFVDVFDDCGPIVTLGPFDTLEEAEEAFELF
jgi:hypothetical protein